MDAIAVSVLVWLSSVLGATPMPEPHSIWKTAGWEMQGEHPRLVVTANLQELSCNPGEYLHSPILLYGAIEVSHEGRLLRRFGDPTLQSPNFVFNSPYIACNELPSHGVLQFDYHAYSKSYAQLTAWPEVTSGTYLEFFLKYSYAAGAFALLFLAMFVASSTFARQDKKMGLLISASAVLIAIYELGTISPIFNLQVPMIDVHRISDISLSLGMVLLFSALAMEGLLSKRMIQLYLFVVAVSFAFWLTAKTGDGVQLGSTIQFPIAILCIFWCLVLGLKRLYHHFSLHSILIALVTSCFLVSVISDMTLFAGLGTSFSVLPFGISMGFLIFGIIMNSKIEATYRERDYLRSNLELEVERKTAELKSAQAELVVSAKLASLGTLSAGIAHEINNSLNYVNGALQPLEKMVTKGMPEAELPKVARLFTVMKEGLNLTFGVIKSLRTYTGLNQGKFNDVQIGEVVSSVLTILRTKTRNKIDVQTEIPPDLMIYGSVVGLNQVLMNLISNAIDAMGESGTLRITGERKGAHAVIKVSDTGSGMSQQVQDRIFDPFFTTKDVRKGTGLGLHIVKGEIDRHQGKISVQSAVGVGTTFIIELPTAALDSKATA